MKKILSLLLSFSLCLTLCTFVGTVAAEDEPITLTYWTDFDSTKASVMGSLEENLVMQELMARMGVTLRFLHPAVGQGTEQFNLMIASRELPDIIEYGWNAYPGGVQKAIDDQIIIDLTDMLADNAPNYNAFFQKQPELAKQVKTDDGKVCVFAAFSISDYNVQSGYVIRQDWLDELGLSTPVTIADWEETLLTLMKAKNLECGFATGNTNFYHSDNLCGAWNVGIGFYMDNDEVKFGPMQDAFRDYLETMARWYDLGILDPDFAASDAKVMQNYLINGQTASGFAFSGGDMGNVYAAVEAKENTEFKLVGVQYPVTEANTTPKFVNRSWEYRGAGSAAITTANQHPEVSAKLLDYFFSEEGRLLKSFGVEDKTFTYVDGVPTYTDLLLHNPDGLSMAQAMALYLRANYPCVGFIETGYHEQYFARPVQKNAAQTWNTYSTEATAVKVPQITPTSEEASTLANLTSAITPYVQEMIVKFIMGQEPLENFDAFRTQLTQMGIEQALEIEQAAYARYLAR